eukprot:gene32735-41660_t
MRATTSKQASEVERLRSCGKELAEVRESLGRSEEVAEEQRQQLRRNEEALQSHAYAAQVKLDELRAAQARCQQCESDVAKLQSEATMPAVHEGCALHIKTVHEGCALHIKTVHEGCALHIKTVHEGWALHIKTVHEGYMLHIKTFHEGCALHIKTVHD